MSYSYALETIVTINAEYNACPQTRTLNAVSTFELMSARRSAWDKTGTADRVEAESQERRGRAGQGEDR